MPQPIYIFRGNAKTQRDTLGLIDTFYETKAREIFNGPR